MVSQFPEDNSRRPTDIVIAVRKRCNQLGNARLHGLMEDSCDSWRDARKCTERVTYNGGPIYRMCWLQNAEQQSHCLPSWQ
jgi:hypothetical protein